MRCKTLLLSSILPFTSTGYCEKLRFITEPTVTTDASGHSFSTESELTRELITRLKLPATIEVYPWKRAYSMLQREPNIVLFPTTRTETREKQAKWVGPILKVSWVFYANKNSSIKINSLENAMKVDRVCGYIGDAKFTFLKEQGFKNLVPRHLSADCLDLLARNKIDLWVSTDNVITSTPEENNEQLAEIKIAYTINTKYLYYALSKNISDDTVKLLQATLNKMKKEGAIHKHYQGHYSDRVIQETSKIDAPIFPWLDKTVQQ